MPKGTTGNGAKSRAKTKGRVHTNYAQLLIDLTNQAKAQHAAMQFTEPRPWQHPSTFTGDVFNIQQLGMPAYDRDALNVNYAECVNDPKNAGTVGDVISLKLQIAYMAAQEQAYRHRHASLARCMAHATGRRYGHGNGPLFERIRKEPEDFIKSGGA